MAIPMNSILLVACLQSVSALRISPSSNSGIEMEVVPEFAPLHTLKAIQNVNSGVGSVWLFHTTHHAGTSLMGVFNRTGLQWDPKRKKVDSISEEDLVQPKMFFNDVCGERGINVSIGKFGEAFSRNSDKLLTIYPIRHPIHRNMAADGRGNWEINPDGCFTNNYGLRKLLGIGFDVQIEKHHIEAAKARAASFDIIMDMTNFTEGLQTLCSHLDWSCKNTKPASDQRHYDKVSNFRSEHPDLYNRWVTRNAPEIEFYEFAKKLSQQRSADFSKMSFQAKRDFPAGASEIKKKRLTMPSEPIAVSYQKEGTQWMCR